MFYRDVQVLLHEIKFLSVVCISVGCSERNFFVYFHSNNLKWLKVDSSSRFSPKMNERTFFFQRACISKKLIADIHDVHKFSCAFFLCLLVCKLTQLSDFRSFTQKSNSEEFKQTMMEIWGERGGEGVWWELKDLRLKWIFEIDLTRVHGGLRINEIYYLSAAFFFEGNKLSSSSSSSTYKMQFKHDKKCCWLRHIWLVVDHREKWIKTWNFQSNLRIMFFSAAFFPIEKCFYIFHFVCEMRWWKKN